MNERIDSIVAGFAGQPGPLLVVLHAIQEEFGCIPAEAVPRIAEGLNLSRAEVHGVMTFYHHFREVPPGRHTLRICRAESCQAMNGVALEQHAQRRLAIDFHQTSADGAVTLEPVYCLGLCASSPALMIGTRPHARMSPARLDAVLAREEQA